MVAFRPLLLSGLLLLGPVPARCVAHKLRAVPARPRSLIIQTGGTLSVNFSSLADSPPITAAQGVGVLNLGKVSYIGASSVPGVKIQRAQNAFFVESSLGVQIGNSDSMGGGTAMLRAWLESPVDPYQIYLDGVPLTAQPICIDARTALGVVTRHQLKIRVPSDASERESKLQTEIGLQVVRN